MQIASIDSGRAAAARGARLGATLLGLALVAVCGCARAPSVVVDDVLEPLAPPRPWLPGPADRAAASLARAALVAQAPGEVDERGHALAAPEVEAALADLLATPLREGEEDLAKIAVDLRNATLDDPLAHREASRRLRRQLGIDPRLESRLDRTIDDDPVRLARRRVLDGWHRLWARTFNAVAEPLGNSAITGFVIAPFQLANSIIHYFAEFSNAEPLSHTGRQALVLRQDFLRAHPDTELTPVLEEKIDRAQIKLEKTLALRRVRAAERALERRGDRLAHYQAQSAIDVLAPHPEENGRMRRRAEKARARAAKRIAERDRLDALALTARPTRGYAREAEARLAGRLLAGPFGPDELDRATDRYLSIAGSAGQSRVDYVRSIVQVESGFESDSRRQLARLVRDGRPPDTMGRHASALLQDEWQNPHGAFERLRRQGARDEFAWRVAGEWVRRPRYPNLPKPVAYLIDAPTIAMTVVLAPLRAMLSPFSGGPDFQRGASLAGYRYLLRYPGSSDQREVIDWLHDYEMGRERWSKALRMADLKEDFDPEERLELVEKTADQRMQALDGLDRRDTRASLLKGIARDFPDSEGGHAAGLQARAEYEDASPQQIGITKSFLLENPGVAGRSGVGLNPRLLNDDPADGELHPEGIVLRGGRTLEILMVADGEDEDAKPESLVRRISKQRLMQLASALEESVRRNSLIDPDARQAADASRDVYLERAGLGLTEDVDLRPTAESDFVYRSLRERYGVVRGRDSVLPFDLVFRGSLGEMTLGAFPRWRTPRETPDAFLYR